MSTPDYDQTLRNKTRRRHRKSRDGCFECKRRRIKCDEGKPACMRCVSGFYKCIYPLPPRPAAKKQRDRVSLPSPSCSTLSPSPGGPSYSERSPSAYSILDYVETDRNFSDMDGTSDTELYHHYLQHTCRALTHCQKDQSALQIGMPTLALRHKTVFHSLLAASAVCLGCDMIAKKPQPRVSAVKQVLVAAYHHYNMASERMRESISSLDSLKLEPLLASALMLLPFATASQQINHWLSERNGAPETIKPLSATPRDVIVIMRGIRTTLQTLGCDVLSPEEIAPYPDAEFGKVTNGNTSSSHVMTSIVATTSQAAFTKLQHRMDSAIGHRRVDGSNDSLSACRAAFEVLQRIRNIAFASTLSSSGFNDAGSEISRREDKQVASWLRSYATRFVIPQPTGPLTNFFLNFYVQAPQAYLDLVLPLLDRRLERPRGALSDDGSAELSIEQALALDIYAHWSILMFLVEEESWWIGNLPMVTLTGMVNRYGDDFVSEMWPESRSGQWWPGSMLNILREVKQYQN